MKQLRQLLSNTKHFENSCAIEWKFSTKTAPWVNGCKKCLVGMFKRQFKIMLQKLFIFQVSPPLCA